MLLNFHHLHPEFQKFILYRIQNNYTTKKTTAITFSLIISVSTLVLIFPIKFYIADPFTFVCVQQLLCSTMSVFWGLGIGCLIEYFQNDIEKLVHAFYPLFKVWVQLDYHNLKKLSDMSISIRRFISESSLIIALFYFLVNFNFVH